MKKSIPHITSFHYSLSPSGQVEITLPEGYILPLGHVSEVLADLDSFADCPTDLSWRDSPVKDRVLARLANPVGRLLYDQFGEERWPECTEESFPEVSQGAERARARDVEESFLARLGHSIGRPLTANAKASSNPDAPVGARWRATHPNACLHFELGPCVPAATDGSRVVLFSLPFFGADWLMAHRSNLIGPCTSSRVPLGRWNYITNKPSLYGTPSAASQTRTRAPRGASLFDKAIALLNSLK